MNSLPDSSAADEAAGGRVSADGVGAGNPARDGADGRDGADVGAAGESERVPHVGISLSTFRAGAPVPPVNLTANPVGPQSQPGSQQSAGVGSAEGSGSRPTDTAGAERSQVGVGAAAGPKDNTLLVQALAKMAGTDLKAGLMDVARQLLQGQVLLRVKGDARELLTAGEPLHLNVVTIDGDNYLAAFSSADSVRQSIEADRDTGTSAVMQPVMAVLQQVRGGSFAGLVLDPAPAPARAVLPVAFVQKMVEQADPALTIKSLLAAPRTESTVGNVVRALGRVQTWVAVGTGPDGSPGVAEVRTPGGERYLELFSHPLEILVRGRGERPAPMKPEQVAASLRRDTALAGVLIDQLGPSIKLERADLAPLITSD